MGQTMTAKCEAHHWRINDAGMGVCKKCKARKVFVRTWEELWDKYRLGFKENARRGQKHMRTDAYPR